MRIYVMPIVYEADELRYIGKYVNYMHSNGIIRCSAMPYGWEGWTLVAAFPSPSELLHQALVANSDVMALPEDLTAQIGSNITNVKSRLNAINIPNEFITSDMTWIQLIRSLTKFCLFLRELHGYFSDPVNNFFASGRTLSTQIKDLPVSIRNRLSDFADYKGYDRTGLNNSSTLYQVIKYVADQSDFTWRAFEDGIAV